MIHPARWTYVADKNVNSKLVYFMPGFTAEERHIEQHCDME